MLDIVSFTFLGAVFFCTPVNVKLCFGIQLTYMETLILLGLSSSFVREIHNSVFPEANYFSLLRKDIYEYPAQWAKN